MVALAPGDIVDKLELLAAASGGKQRIHIGKSRPSSIIGATVRPPIIENDIAGKGGFRRREICHAKDGRIPVATRNEVIHKSWGDREGVVHLRDRPGLVALLIEDGADGAGGAGLNTPVPAETEVDLLPVTDVVIDTTRDVALGVET